MTNIAGVTVQEGSSRYILPNLIDPSKPTLYWLDGHWSGGVTGGAEDECPVLAELSAIAGGHPDDCILIDDARMFLAPPPPPHRPEDWPRYREIEDAIAKARPEHTVIEAHDIVVAVPRLCRRHGGGVRACETSSPRIRAATNTRSRPQPLSAVR